jgi:hypothetical protein
MAERISTPNSSLISSDSTDKVQKSHEDAVHLYESARYNLLRKLVKIFYE